MDMGMDSGGEVTPKRRGRPKKLQTPAEVEADICLLYTSDAADE